MAIVELGQFDINLASPLNFATGGFWSSLSRIANPPSARLLMISDTLLPQDVMDGFHLVALPEEYLPPGIRAYRLQYEDYLEQMAHEVRFIRTYLVVETYLGSEGLVSLLGTYGIPARPVNEMVPQPFSGGHDVWKAVVTDNGQHWGLLRSKEQQSGFLYPRALHRLFGLEFPIWAALDIYTFSTQDALQMMRLKSVAARYDKSQGMGAAEARDVLSTVTALQQEMNRYGAALHTLRLYILVGANSAAELRQRLTIAGGAVPLDMEVAPAGEMARVFSDSAPHDSDGAILSTPGVAILVGSALSYRRRTETRGVLLGTDQNQSPVIFNVFDDRNPSYNAVVLGQTGGGKTFAVLTIMMRHMLLGVRGIIVDPQGNIDLSFLGDEYHRSVLGTEGASINILDITRDELMDQVASVKHILKMLGVADYQDSLADALLDEALMDIYEPLWGQGIPGIPGIPAPTLQAVQRRLEYLSARAQLPTVAETAMLMVARMYPLTQGSDAYLFNRPTTVDFSLDRQMTVYDVSRLPDQTTGSNLRAALLAILVADINQAIRRQRRRGDRTPVLFFVDEMGVLMRDPVVAAYISAEYKTARARLVGMIVADQDLHSMLGPADPINGLHYGIPILANAAFTFIFRQKGSEKANIREHFPDIPSRLVDQLPAFGPGTCIAQFPDDLLVVHVEPSPLDRVILSSRLQDRQRAREIIRQLAVELGLTGGNNNAGLQTELANVRRVAALPR